MQAGSSNNLVDSLHGGRPQHEEPHVKKFIKKHGEKVDLILRVDLVRQGGFNLVPKWSLIFRSNFYEKY